MSENNEPVTAGVVEMFGGGTIAALSGIMSLLAMENGNYVNAICVFGAIAFLGAAAFIHGAGEYKKKSRNRKF